MPESEVIEPPAASAPVFPPFPCHPRMLGLGHQFDALPLPAPLCKVTSKAAEDGISDRLLRPWQAAC